MADVGARHRVPLSSGTALAAVEKNSSWIWIRRGTALERQSLQPLRALERGDSLLCSATCQTLDRSVVDSSRSMRSVRTSENPMMALSGVRSSCDMLPRNSDSCWLATSSCRLLSAISRKSRAFWIARVDCEAKVLRTPMTSAENSPGALRDRAVMGDKEEPVAVPAPDDRIVSLAELRRGHQAERV
jgi:hypothetical protein